MTTTPVTPAPAALADLPDAAQRPLRVWHATMAGDVLDAIGPDFGTTTRRSADLLNALEVFRPVVVAGISREGSPAAWVRSLGPTPHTGLLTELGTMGHAFTVLCRSAARGAANSTPLVTNTILLGLLARYDEDFDLPGAGTGH